MVVALALHARGQAFDPPVVHLERGAFVFYDHIFLSSRSASVDILSQDTLCVTSYPKQWILECVSRSSLMQKVPVGALRVSLPW